MPVSWLDEVISTLPPKPRTQGLTQVIDTGFSLRDIEGEPLIEIHQSDAAARGIASGAVVRVFNDRGEYRCKAKVSDRARPGVVNGLGIWWRKLGLDCRLCRVRDACDGGNGRRFRGPRLHRHRSDAHSVE